MAELRPVLQALWYLALTSTKNFAWQTLKRLKQPRYVLGLAFAIGYFWLVFFRQRTSKFYETALGGLNGGEVSAVPGDSMVLLFAAAAVMLLLLLQWIIPGDKPGLKFSEAEVAFLFSAPLARRHLLHYKLMQSLLLSLFSALLVALLSSRFANGLGSTLRTLVAWWLLSSVLSLHNIAAALTLNKYATLGTHKAFRRFLGLALGLAFVAALFWLTLQGKTAWLEVLLFPGTLLVKPFLASGSSLLVALLPLLLAVALHYWWVLRMETPFEEASIALATLQAERLKRFKEGKSLRLTSTQQSGRKEPFTLRSWMPIELALYWKNIMQAPAYLNRYSWLAFVVLAVVGMQWLLHHQEAPFDKVLRMLGVVGFLLLFYLFMFGPLLARFDLRMDLSNADLLRTWPHPGWRIVLGSLLAPIVVLSSLGLVFIVLGTFGTVHREVPGLFADGLRWAVIATASLLLLPLVALQLLMPNVMALYFPAWAQAQRQRQRGFEVMGLQLFLMVGQALLLVLSLLPALLCAGVTVFLLQWSGSVVVTWGVTVLVVAAVLVLEVLYGIYLLGERFEQLDIASEIR